MVSFFEIVVGPVKDIGKYVNTLTTVCEDDDYTVTFSYGHNLALIF